MRVKTNIPHENNLMGRTGRKIKREKRRSCVIKKLKSLMSQHLPRLENSNIQDEEFVESIDRLNKNLLEKMKSIKEISIARMYLASFIDEGNSTGKWSLPVPMPLVRLTRIPPLRTEKWFRECNKHADIYKALMGGLHREDASIPFSKDVIIGLILYSAVCHGGLGDTGMLVALAQSLNEGLILNYSNDLDCIWLDLECKSHSVANIKRDGKFYLMRRWYPDVITLGLILRLKNENHVKQDQKINVSTVLGLVNRVILYLGKVSCAYQSIGSLCRVGSSVLENSENIDLPQVIFEWNLGRVKAVSLNSQYWEQLIQSNDYLIRKFNFNDFDKLNISKGKQKAKKVNIENISASQIFRSLSRILNPYKNNGRKSTSNEVIKKLCNIRIDSVSDGIQMLINWYLYLLNEKNLKVSSVNQYHLAISKSLIIYTEMVVFDDLDELDFELLYNEIANKSKTDKRRRYVFTCLKSFHEYGMEFHEFPAIDSKYFRSNCEVSFVRAGYVSESLYQCLRASIRNLKNLDKKSILSLELLIIVAYRSAMRLGELIKLQLGDIEKSSSRWVFIHNNKFGNNKRMSSLRKIPLYILLRPDEQACFDRYYQARQTMADSQKEPFFVRTGASSVPWHNHVVRNMVNTILRKSSSIEEFTFNHFRHSALSRLQLIIESEWELVSKLSAYTIEEARSIRSAVVGHSSVGRDRYYALASFAGHSTPEPTFRNYLHFNDLLTHSKIGRNQIKFSLSFFKNITGISSNKITRIIKAQNLDPSCIPVQALNNEIVLRLRPFLYEIKNTKKIKQPDIHKTEVFKPQVDIEVCYRVLSEYQTGIQVSQLVYKYNLPEELINQWIKSSLYIAGLKTRSGKPRHISDKRLDKSNKVFLPAKLRHSEEQIEAARIIQKFREVYKLKSNEIIFCIKYVLGNTHMSISGIYFKEKEDLKRFLKVLNTFVPYKRWYMCISMPAHSDPQRIIKVWKIHKDISVHIEGRNILDTKKYPQGRIVLHLLHENASYLKATQNLQSYKYTASTLRYVFIMLGIMLLKHERSFDDY